MKAKTIKPSKTEDERDADVARKRISEIREHPDRLVTGEALRKRLAELDCD